MNPNSPATYIAPDKNESGPQPGVALCLSGGGYRHTPTRSVMRFKMRPSRNEAALYVQIPLGPEHSIQVRVKEMR